jgi:hypothetical protein
MGLADYKACMTVSAGSPLQGQPHDRRFVRTLAPRGCLPKISFDCRDRWTLKTFSGAPIGRDYGAHEERTLWSNHAAPSAKVACDENRPKSMLGAVQSSASGHCGSVAKQVRASFRNNALCIGTFQTFQAFGAEESANSSRMRNPDVATNDIGQKVYAAWLSPSSWVLSSAAARSAS